MTVTEPWWKTLYAQIAEIHPMFAGVPDDYARSQINVVVDLLGLAPGARVLDLGCGAGRHSVLLAEQGYDVVGVDLTQPQIERAKAQGSSAVFHVGDMRDPPVDGPFDACILMDESLCVFDDDADAQAVLRRVRELSDAVLIELFNPYAWAEPRDNEFELDGQTIKRSYWFDAELGRIHDQITTQEGKLPIQSLRAWTPPEIKAMLRAAGFDSPVVRFCRGFEPPAEPVPFSAKKCALYWAYARAPA